MVAEGDACLCRDVNEGNAAPVFWIEGTRDTGERQRTIAHLPEQLASGDTGRVHGCLSIGVQVAIVRAPRPGKTFVVDNDSE